MSRKSLLAAAVFALSYAAAFFLRIYVVDTPVSGAQENAVLGYLRQGVLVCQLDSVWGGLSLASGVAALFSPWRWTVYAWGVLTALALANYNGDLGVVGLALGLLRLARF